MVRNVQNYLTYIAAVLRAAPAFFFDLTELTHGFDSFRVAWHSHIKGLFKNIACIYLVFKELLTSHAWGIFGLGSSLFLGICHFLICII